MMNEVRTSLLRQAPDYGEAFWQGLAQEYLCNLFKHVSNLNGGHGLLVHDATAYLIGRDIQSLGQSFLSSDDCAIREWWRKLNRDIGGRLMATLHATVGGYLAAEVNVFLEHDQIESYAALNAGNMGHKTGGVQRMIETKTISLRRVAVFNYVRRLARIVFWVALAALAVIALYVASVYAYEWLYPPAPLTGRVAMMFGDARRAPFVLYQALGWCGPILYVAALSKHATAIAAYGMKEPWVKPFAFGTLLLLSAALLNIMHAFSCGC